MFPHFSVSQLRLCVAIICIVFLWQTYRYMSVTNLPSLTRIQSNAVDGSTEVVLLPVDVEVYYEALCPDSRSFFLKQLLPTYEKIPSAMNIKLIPYGKAKTHYNGVAYEFECQHGPQECLANKVHACSIDLIADPGLSVRYAACMIIDNMNAEMAGSSCARKLGIDWESIWSCARGTHGSELLSKHGKQTDAVDSISFIPTILIQGSIDRQPAILKDLLGEICKLYSGPKPEGCE